MFADDTCLIYTGNDLQHLTSHVNDRLARIHDWCNANQLAINPAKSEYMIFTNRMIIQEPIIKLGNDQINRKESVKYLGLQIDDKLKFTLDLIDNRQREVSELEVQNYSAPIINLEGI